MRQDYCDITLLLDRSGSMANIWEDTIGGINTFIEAQKKATGKCTLTLVQFDDHYEPNYVGVEAQHVAPLNKETYTPRGSTALLDAMGKAIVVTGTRLNNMPEYNRPAKVMFVVITDGQENASHEYTKRQVKEMVDRQTNNYKWEFVYLGADVNAFSEASGMGIHLSNVIRYAKTHVGVQGIYDSLTNNTLAYRSAASGTNDPLAWTAEDRKTQEDAEHGQIK